jgi:hypothetical protein
MPEQDLKDKGFTFLNDIRLVCIKLTQGRAAGPLDAPSVKDGHSAQRRGHWPPYIAGTQIYGKLVPLMESAYGLAQNGRH